MEASTSRLAPASDTAANPFIRQRPVIQAAPHGPASKPPWLHFLHPANNRIFLSLPALDYSPPSTFRMHHGTALTACQIIACNEDGYLSRSLVRDQDVIKDDFESVIPPGKYYYHLRSPEPTLYPICHNFPLWKFPHKKLPAAWENKLQETASISTQNWTAMSLAIKNRDQHCLISLSQDGLTTAHLVPKIQEAWVTRMLIFDIGLSLICHLTSSRKMICMCT